MSYGTSEKHKKSGKADQTSWDLDQRCAYLLGVLGNLHNRYPEKTYGFNELYRELDKRKNRKLKTTVFSRQTLSQHLKHLLDKELIEVREDKDSYYKIKPRKYRLSKYLVEITKDLRPLEDLYYEEMLKDYRLLETSPLTILLLRAYMRMGVEIFRKTLAFPEFFGMYQRDHVYTTIEILTKEYKTIIHERNESEKALKILDEFYDFVKQKLDEKYGSL